MYFFQCFLLKVILIVLHIFVHLLGLLLKAAFKGKRVDSDIRGRSLNTLELKEAIAKFRIFSEYDCFAHYLKRINLIDSKITVLCSLNSIMNSEHLFQ